MIAGDRFYLGHLGKTPVYIVPEAAFSLLFIWAFWSDGTFPGFLLAVMAFITVILIHESGHAVVARINGMQGVSITLSAMGGYCNYSGEHRPSSELAISLAGPIVNLATAGILWLVVTYQPHLVSGFPEMVLQYGFVVFWASVVLGCFNLLPIYPLDGGQATLAAARMVTRNEANARRFTLSVAVAGVIPALVIMHLVGLRIDYFTFFIFAMLLFSAFRALR